MLTPEINQDKFSEYKNFYNDHGYLVIENVFSNEDCFEFKANSEKFSKEPDYPVSLNVHRESDFFFNIISNNQIVSLIKFLQDADIDAVNDQYLFKKANTKYGRQSWTLHQDNSYPKAKKDSYIICHVAIDRSEKENGGLIYLDGSHKEDIIDFKNNKSWKEESDLNGITRPGQTITNKDTMLEKYTSIDMIFPKGSISIMHGNLIHGSHANLSLSNDRNQYSMAYMNRGVDFFPGKMSPRIRKKLY
jgi:ectoine hydroxylase-related dioxygenase (phytanoyl-CoA dioxygenase family)